MKMSFREQDYEWNLKHGIAESRAEGKAEGVIEGESKKEKQVATAMVNTMEAEGKDKNEIISFMTKVMNLPKAAAERYYDQAMAVH